MNKRKICVVTGTRADYGLLYWLMKEIDVDPALELQLIVTGTHLEPRFANTVEVIEDDGFRINARVQLDINDDKPVTVARATGAAVAGIAAALDTLKPDIVVVLGDRYEILAAATAAMLSRIPIAHIHGGEVTEGALDDSMRHAISKMSCWHFVAAEPYRQRLIQMGEHPSSIMTVGAPGLDHLSRTPMLDRLKIADVLGIEYDQPYFLITHHPTTLGEDEPIDEIRALLSALDDYRDYACIFTGVNADPGHDLIAQEVHDYVATQKDRARLFVSLGQQRYLSAMSHSSAVIGNSSSGIIEAPACKVATVNIGTRQKGRLRASSVLDCAVSRKSIHDAIAKAIAPDFLADRLEGEPPYGLPGASLRIKSFLAGCSLGESGSKSFYDLPITKVTA